ncbi:hypothetical protein, partial [Enterobacter hormaechei]
NTDDLFVGKTLLHGDVLMWLMKTLLTSGCTNQRGAGQTEFISGRVRQCFLSVTSDYASSHDCAWRSPACGERRVLNFKEFVHHDASEK